MEAAKILILTYYLHHLYVDYGHSRNKDVCFSCLWLLIISWSHVVNIPLSHIYIYIYIYIGGLEVQFAEGSCIKKLL